MPEMKILRVSTREEVVSYYISSELHRLVEHADRGDKPDSSILNLSPNPNEGALQHMSRMLLGELRKHSWLHTQFWERNLDWFLISLAPNEVDAMPMGGDVATWKYPKLDILVHEIQEAHKRGAPVSGLSDDPQLLLKRRSKELMNRIIVIEGLYEKRAFKFAIGDGAHRAIAQAADGVLALEAYWGAPSGSQHKSD